MTEPGLTPRLGEGQAVAVAIRSQLSAQRRQASTHSCMSPTASQLAAHARQISAQARQTAAWWAEFRAMKFIAVWQISAQSSMSRI